LLSLTTGSFEKVFNVSESPFKVGAYFSNVLVSSFDNSIVSGTLSLSDFITASGSITFHESWKSLDSTVIFREGNLTIEKSQSLTGIFEEFELNVFTSGPEKVGQNENVLIRPKFYNLKAEDRSSKFAFAKKPIPLKGTYRIVDYTTGEVYVDFNDLNQLSYDSNGNFFEMNSNILPTGRIVGFDFKINHLGIEKIINDRSYTIRLGE
jgi:hypothetical protein